MIESADPEWAVILNTGGGIVANVNSETGPDASSAPATRKMPRDANARLIAAAPELLTALEELTDWGREHTSPRDENSPHRLLINARAALTKATS